jgi:hypothetical protein
LLALFDYYSREGTKETQIGAAASKDDGRSWSGLKPIKLSNGKGATLSARHPAALPLPDGRLRLYFTIDAAKSRPAGDGKTAHACVIHSAVAHDGLRFRVEPDMGVRFQDLSDAKAAAVQIGPRTHLYVSPRSAPRSDSDEEADDTVRHAAARDGRRFARVAPVEVEGVVAIDSIVRHGDGLRAYVTTDAGIRSMVGEDGAHWKLEPGIRVPSASDVAVTRLKDGSFLMLYATRDRETADAGQLVAAAETSEGAPPPPVGDEGDNPDGGALPAAAEPTDDAEPAAAETDAFSFAPSPDFESDVDYVHWYGENLVDRPEENAFDAYAEFMPDFGDDRGNKPPWPDFNDMFNSEEYKGPPGPWNPADHPEWEASARDAKDLLVKFHEAVKLPTYACRYKLDPDEMGPPDESGPVLMTLLIPALSPHRTLTRATLADAWRAENGKVSPERMTDAWETVLRGASHLAQGATLIESLVAIAERSLVELNARWALKSNVFDERGLETALQTLRKYDQGLEDPIRGVRGEHAMALEATQYLFSPPGDDGQPTINREHAQRVADFIGDARESIDRLGEMGPEDVRTTVEAFNAHYREIAEQLRTGYPDVRASDLEATAESYVHTSPLTELLLPALSRYYKLRTRTEASRRATQLAYAAHIFRARTGHWPRSLDELPAEVGKTMRTDPFTGRPFGYRVSEDGPTVYSFSENGVDDGGVHSPQWDDGVENDSGSDDYVFWPPQEKPPDK